jgi:hypothetical protein
MNGTCSAHCGNKFMHNLNCRISGKELLEDIYTGYHSSYRTYKAMNRIGNYQKGMCGCCYMKDNHL